MLIEVFDESWEKSCVLSMSPKALFRAHSPLTLQVYLPINTNSETQDERAAQVPTVMQAGYAAGLLFLCPLGDIFRRRAFVLILVFCTATMVLTHHPQPRYAC